MSIIFEAIGKIFGEDRPKEDYNLDPLDIETGTLFDIGTSWIHFMKKLLIPRYARTGYQCPSLCTPDEAKRQCIPEPTVRPKRKQCPRKCNT